MSTIWMQSNQTGNKERSQTNPGGISTSLISISKAQPTASLEDSLVEILLFSQEN